MENTNYTSKKLYEHQVGVHQVGEICTPDRLNTKKSIGRCIKVNIFKGNEKNLNAVEEK